MSILGQVARRLQTDLAETSRAIIDPKFGEKLDNERINARNLERTEKAWLKRHNVEREAKIRDRDNERSYQAQMKGLEMLIKEAETTGRFGKLIDYAETPGLHKEVSDFARSMGSQLSQKSWDVLKQEENWRIKADELNLRQLKQRFEREKFDEQRAQWEIENLQKREQQYIENLEAVNESARKTSSFRSIKNFFLQGSKADRNMTIEEQTKYLAKLGDSHDPEWAQKVMEMYITEKERQITEANKTERAGITAAGMRPDTQTSITNNDVREIKIGFTDDFLDQAVSASGEDSKIAKLFKTGRFFDTTQADVDKARNKFAFAVASMVSQIQRSGSRLPDAVLQEEASNLLLKHIKDSPKLDPRRPGFGIDSAAAMREFRKRFQKDDNDLFQ